jgi:hypothetical protein
MPNLCAQEELGEQPSGTTLRRDISQVRRRLGFLRSVVMTVRWWCSSSSRRTSCLHAADVVRLVPGILLLEFFLDDVRGTVLQTSACIEP